MATKQKSGNKRPAGKTKRKGVALRTQNRRLQRELDKLREENRRLMRSLGTLICKDDPVQMDLTPADGVFDPPLTELIAQIERAGK